MASGMKKAKIPAGIRRGGQAARSAQRDVDEPELEAPEQAAPAGNTTSPGLPRSDREKRHSTSGSTSSSVSSKRGGGRTAAPAPAKRNPYAGQKRRPMNHLIFEEIPSRLGQLSEELVNAGYPERSASQAQLTQAILHFGMPGDRDEAGELLQRWILLTSAGSW